MSENIDNNANLNQENLKQNIKKRGSKEEVFHGLALQTGGGLRKADLIKNKRGQIVSKKRSEQGAKQFKNIEKYIAEKKKAKEDKPKENEEPEELLSKNEKSEPEEPEEEIPKEEAPEPPSEIENPSIEPAIPPLAPKQSNPIELKPEAVQEMKNSDIENPKLPEAPKPLERKKRGRKPKEEKQ